MAVRSRTRKAAPRRAAPKTQKWVYLFADKKAEGNAKMRELLGGKGAGLAEMTNAGLPVPAGFTITTAACNAYFASGKKLPPGLWDQVEKALATIERATKKNLGDPKDPLLVSVRSGAAMSMPGMMDTVLNLGLNDESRTGLAKLTKNERFAWDAYRRFISMFGRIVLGIDPSKFEQALEFTIERGKLYMLQTRSAKRTAAAAIKIATDMVKEGLITKDEAITRVEPAQVE